MPANLPELFQQSAEKFGNRPAFVSKDESKSYKPVTFQEVYDLGINLAEALIDLGVSAKENVALLADNRLEWIVSDYGILMAGAADVPRGTDITDSEIAYILNHCEAKVVFLENDKMLEKFQKNRSQLEFAKTLIVMDKKSTATGVLKLYDLIEKVRT